MKRTKLRGYTGVGGKARAVSIRFEKLGNWEREVSKLALLDSRLKSSIKYAEGKVAKQLLKKVINHLKNQDLGWDPLSESTLWKKKGDSRVLIDTETYLNNITTWSASGVRFIGVKKSVTNPNNGEEVWRIAQIHEFRALNGGPDRALWGPSLEEMGGNKGTRDIIFKVIH